MKNLWGFVVAFFFIGLVATTPFVIMLAALLVWRETRKSPSPEDQGEGLAGGS